MAPKKKGGKGKKGKKKGGEFDLDVDENNHVLEKIRESLITKLVSETDSADKKKA